MKSPIQLRRFNRWMRRARIESLEVRALCHGEPVAEVSTLTPAVVNPAPEIPNRTTIEGQGDWEHAVTGNWHLHLAAPLPVGETVKGVLRIPVRLVIHHHEKLLVTRVFLNDNGAKLKFDKLEYYPGNQPGYTTDGDTRTYAFDLFLDTRKTNDGWRDFSLRADVIDTTAGRKADEFNIQIEWLSYVDNGRRDQNHRNDWAADVGYRGVRVSAWSETEKYQRIWATVPQTLAGTQAIDYYHGSTDTRVGGYHEAYVSKGHAIPARGEWKAQAAAAGVFIGRTTRDEKLTRVLVDTALLADGFHAPQFFQHTGKVSDVRLVFWAEKK